jgi:hypothetical protein
MIGLASRKNMAGQFFRAFNRLGPTLGIRACDHPGKCNAPGRQRFHFFENSSRQAAKVIKGDSGMGRPE